jgi:hypothetical protein
LTARLSTGATGDAATRAAESTVDQSSGIEADFIMSEARSRRRARAFYAPRRTLYTSRVQTPGDRFASRIYVLVLIVEALVITALYSLGRYFA